MGSLLNRSAEIGARTTQGPAHRGASSQHAGGWPSPPAANDSNAYYAAEVQSILPLGRGHASENSWVASRKKLLGENARPYSRL